MGKISFRHLSYSGEENLAVNRDELSRLDRAKSPGFSADGYIENQRALPFLRYAARDAAYCGCGWIAVWNLLRAMGTPPDEAELISGMERGCILRGVFGTGPFFLRRYVSRRLGFRARVGLSPFVGAPGGIVMYVRPNLSAHYVAFFAEGEAANGKPLYRFFNADKKAGFDPDKKRTPAMGMEEFLRREPRLFTLFYKIG